MSNAKRISNKIKTLQHRKARFFEFPSQADFKREYLQSPSLDRTHKIKGSDFNPHDMGMSFKEY